MKKRVFDLTTSTIAVVALSPLLLFVAILIKITSPGPIFYRGERIGRYERPFQIYKFRTMIQDADKIGGASSADDDPRITSLGLWLRHYKIDELPQLLNVIKGEMAIVGPRPEVLEYVKLMSRYSRKVILNIRPGLTDFASLLGINEGKRLSESINPDETYLKEIVPTKRRLQTTYAERQSFSLDIRLILETIKRILV